MHLFLSPHFDDAVFSCGGAIAQLARQGAHVLIYTALGGFPENAPATPFVQRLHRDWGIGESAVPVIECRRKEDMAAARMLGATARFGGHPDAIYRVHPVSGEALYPHDADIFGDVQPGDPAHAHALMETLQETLTGAEAVANVTHLYGPLGVGHHVDHQQVRDLALMLVQVYPAIQLSLYEDYPYVRHGEVAVQAAFRALEKSLGEAVHLSRALARVVHTLSVEDQEAKIRANLCYKSQIGPTWEDEVRSYLEQSGGESTWDLQRAPQKGSKHE